MGYDAWPAHTLRTHKRSHSRTASTSTATSSFVASSLVLIHVQKCTRQLSAIATARHEAMSALRGAITTIQRATAQQNLSFLHPHPHPHPHPHLAHPHQLNTSPNMNVCNVTSRGVMLHAMRMCCGCHVAGVICWRCRVVVLSCWNIVGC